MSKRVFLSVGDESAANYVAEIFREGFEDLDLVGITTPKMEKAGIRSIHDVSELSVVGVAEVLPRLMKIRKIFKDSLEEIKSCDVLVACDVPGFNLRLIKKARQLGVERIIYFISPQVWAWKPKRAETIAKYADHLVLILPFEEEIYRPFVNDRFMVHFLGHPLVDMARPTLSEEEFRNLTGLESEFINLMPGSRWSEIKKHWPLVRYAVESLMKVGKREFVIPTFERFRAFLEERLSGLPVKVITEEEISSPSYNAMAYSAFSIIASGTASLEATILKNPHVIFYRVSPLTYFLGRFFVKVKFASLSNIILGREIIPEFINKGEGEMLERVVSLMGDEERIREMKTGMEEVKKRLGGGGSLDRLRELFKDILYNL